MKTKRGFAAFVLAALMLFTAACGSGAGSGKDDGAAGQNQKPSEPVKLLFYSHYLNDFDNYFNNIIKGMTEKKFPHITIEFLMGLDKNPKLDELISSGVNPDIIYAAQSYALVLRDNLKAVDDLAPYIKKVNLDLNKFEPSVMDGIKSYGTKGEIYALPFAMSPWALYYNKDIFNKFGVPYPKDSMTWDETIELAAKVTRQDGGVQYKGIALQLIDKMALQLSLPYVDPKTEKAALDSDGWKKLFNQMKRVVSIPGVFEGAEDISLYSNGLEKRTVAMVTNNNKIPRYLEEEKNGLNWDLTTFPSYPEQMNVYPSVEANSLILNVASKHKDEAFKVIEYLVSDEVQLALAKSLQMSALKGEQFTKAFGENYPALKTKNLQGMFKGRPAPLKPTTIYDDLGLKAARDAYKEVTVNNKDINTALREANEKLNQAIAAEKAK